MGLGVVLLLCGACTGGRQIGNGSAPEDFMQFYQRFHRDSLFQRSRVRFPLDGYRIEGGRITAWSGADWAPHRNGLEAIDTTVYRIERLRGEGEIREKIYQDQGGLLIERHFRLLDQRWWLTFYLYVFL